MIGFWKKESGNIMNHSKGLSEEQVKFLQSLKVGDRLIVYTNQVAEGENKPTHNLKKYEKKAQ